MRPADEHEHDGDDAECGRSQRSLIVTRWQRAGGRWQDYLPPTSQNTLRTPAIARIRNRTNNTKNRPARNFAIANDAPAIDVKPRTAAIMPTTRNSNANCSMSPPPSARISCEFYA